jgi:hypothetical protein
MRDPALVQGGVSTEAFAVDASAIGVEASPKSKTSSRAVAEYLSVLDDAAFSRATPVEPKAISPTDPAARYTASANSVAAYTYSDSDFGASARGEGGGARLNWQSVSTIWTASPCVGAQTKHEPHGFSIERSVLLVQSNCRLVGFLLRPLRFGGEVHANNYFAFHFRHRKKISELVETGPDRLGFELGGHVGDVTGNVERFPRHSHARRIVGSSRRSRWSALSGSPISGFPSYETYFCGHPMKLFHVKSHETNRGQSGLLSFILPHGSVGVGADQYVEERKPGRSVSKLEASAEFAGAKSIFTCPRGGS